MKLLILEALQNAKKHRWDNFGESDLSEQEVGFNEGIDFAIQRIKDYVLKIELNHSLNMTEQMAVTSALDHDHIVRRKMCEELAHEILKKDLARIEFKYNPMMRARIYHGTVFVL